MSVLMLTLYGFLAVSFASVWEMLSHTPPFAGLHHGEIIHRVVTEDLRPGGAWLFNLALPVPLPMACCCNLNRNRNIGSMVCPALCKSHHQ